jgi:hypothetical protein
MSCKNCDCLDCRTERVVAKFKNRANDMGDDLPVARPDDLDDGWATPIHRPRWQDAEPANVEQAKAWTTIINAVFDRYSGKAINMPALLYVVVGNIPGLKEENRDRVSLQVERFLHESPDFELRSGKNGGVFRQSRFLTERHGELPQATSHVVSVTINNHTCKCGNTKCNKTEKSCWKCGAPIT